MQASGTRFGSAEKLFKRLIISGEPGLREVFLRGVAVAAGKVERLAFQETEPASDFAQICTRLQTATDVLRQQQEQEAAAAAAAGAPPAAATDGAADASSHAKDAPGVAPAPSQDQHSGGQNSGAAEAKAPEAPDTEAGARESDGEEAEEEPKHPGAIVIIRRPRHGRGRRAGIGARARRGGPGTREKAKPRHPDESADERIHNARELNTTPGLLEPLWTW